MRSGIKLKSDMWMSFFPSTDFCHVQAHYINSHVRAPGPQEAIELISKRLIAPWRAFKIDIDITQEDVFDWKRQYNLSIPDQDCFRLSIRTWRTPDQNSSTNHFILCKVTQKLLNALNSYYPNGTMKPKKYFS